MSKMRGVQCGRHVISQLEKLSETPKFRNSGINKETAEHVLIVHRSLDKTVIMEKFLKSFFTSTEKKKVLEDLPEEDKNDFIPPLGDRRTTTISRSGRMRHNNKMRHSLTLDMYGETNQPIEKPKSLEYHVNKVVSEQRNQKKRSEEPKVADQISEPKSEKTQRKKSITPEEEIDSAFEIIDKAL